MALSRCLSVSNCLLQNCFDAKAREPRPRGAQVALSPDELAELESAEDWVSMMAQMEEQVRQRCEARPQHLLDGRGNGPPGRGFGTRDTALFKKVPAPRSNLPSRTSPCRNTNI